MNPSNPRYQSPDPLWPSITHCRCRGEGCHRCAEPEEENLMKTEEEDKPTSDELRVKIAELCGAADRWRVMKRGYYYRPNSAGYTANESEAGIYTELEAASHASCASGEITKKRASLPDYPRDHNAMAEARKCMSPFQLRAYGMELHEFLARKIEADGKVRWIFDADARDQAEVFLMVMEAAH